MVERKTKKLENETCYDRLMINECLIVYNKKKRMQKDIKKGKVGDLSLWSNQFLVQKI
jgi:hypothetical protein